MKILIVSQYYYPENFRVNDIAEHLVSLGNEVTVLTGLPNYPMGKIFDGYKAKDKREEYRNGVHIIRVKEIARRKGIIFRFLNYWSFAYYGSKKLKKIIDDYDVIFTPEVSPIHMCVPGMKYAKKHNKPFIIYEMDLWPESLVCGGIKKYGLLYKYYFKKSRKIYNSASLVLVSSKPHISYLKDYLKISNNVEFLPQYAESIFEENKGEYIKPEFMKYKYNFVFAGNIGTAQHLDTILKATEQLKNNHDIGFIIVGNGTKKQELEEYGKNHLLSNVIFPGSFSIKDMPCIYHYATAMIVSLSNDSFAKLTLPGKVQSFMAASKPILAIDDGYTGEIIKEADCGLVSGVDDFKTLADNIINMINDEQMMDKFKINSSNYYQSNYKRDNFFEKLITYMEKLITNGK